MKNVGQHLLSYIAITFELLEEKGFSSIGFLRFYLTVSASVNLKSGSIPRTGDRLYAENKHVFRAWDGLERKNFLYEQTTNMRNFPTQH